MKRQLSPDRLVGAGVLASLAALAACQQAPPPFQGEGSSSFTFITPPEPEAASKGQAEGTEDAVVETLLLAVPIEPLARPEYPRSVLGRERLPVSVGVRIVVDETGRVADVRPSLAAFSSPSAQLSEFRSAVEEAVRQWRFRPAELRRLKRAVDAEGRPGWALLGRQPAECAFDVAFVFQATGEVLSRGVP